MVSVIIPVYNVEEYIERCVQSVIDQTFSDIEIILVDDGSKDNSGAICDRYANEDSRVLVIHKKNGGLSDARNVGIEKSHGEYITFVDGDDCISSDYVSYLFEIINTFNADIAVGQFWINRSTDSPSLPAKNQREHIETLKQDEALERLLHGKISVSATTKLFKRRLFEKVRFPVGKQFEDVGTTYKLIMNSNVIGVGNRYIYSYFMRPSSIVHQSFSLSKLDRVELAHQALIDITGKKAYLKTAAERYYLSHCIATLRVVPIDSKYNSVRKTIVSNIRRHASSVLRNGQVSTVDKISVIAALLGKYCFKAASLVFEIVKNGLPNRGANINKP